MSEPKSLNAVEVGEVLDEFGFSDGTINADDTDAQRMAEEVVRLRAAARGAVNRLRYVDAQVYDVDVRNAMRVLASALDVDSEATR